MSPDDHHHLELRTLVFVRELDTGPAEAHLLRSYLPAEGLRKYVALAAFCQLHELSQRSFGGPQALALLDRAWDRLRLEDVAARARTWLDRDEG